jgi:ferrous iron transport protein A
VLLYANSNKKKEVTMVLSEAPKGASFIVIKVALGKEVGRRLADMGFTEGTPGAVVRLGFFHGPIQVRIRGYDILIRRSEAAGIEVDPVGDWSAVHDAVRWFGRKKLQTPLIKIEAHNE